MSGDGVNKQRRYFLIGATSVVGGLGVVGAAVPFVKSWSPSARARALGGPITVDISKLNPGEMLGPIPAWRGQPVFILYRTPAALEELPKLDATRADPNSERDQQPPYAKNTWRSRRPEIGVYLGLCTHLSCSPKYFPVVTPEPWDAKWEGGFFCPCHGSMFDLAGRVRQGVPAPANLVVPPYSFPSDKVIAIGIDEEHA
jgi:ubiquinol-cytochrome c reductase iron-sulfur subunit